MRGAAHEYSCFKGFPALSPGGCPVSLAGPDAVDIKLPSRQQARTDGNTQPKQNGSCKPDKDSAENHLEKCHNPLHALILPVNSRISMQK